LAFIKNTSKCFRKNKFCEFLRLFVFELRTNRTTRRTYVRRRAMVKCGYIRISLWFVRSASKSTQPKIKRGCSQPDLKNRFATPPLYEHIWVLRKHRADRNISVYTFNSLCENISHRQHMNLIQHFIRRECNGVQYKKLTNR